MFGRILGKSLRKTETKQLEIGGVFVEDIEIGPKSRDDIPALLLGLQHLHLDPGTRSQTFALLESEICPKVGKSTGHPGMNLRIILVLAVLKQGLDCDFDRLVHYCQSRWHGRARCSVTGMRFEMRDADGDRQRVLAASGAAEQD